MRAKICDICQKAKSGDYWKLLNSQWRLWKFDFNWYQYDVCESCMDEIKEKVRKS